jgi:hypothetical protein
MGRTLYVSGLAVLLAAGAALGVSAAGKITTIPVVVTIADSANGAWLRAQSDTRGAYVNTSKVSSTIITNMQGSDWQLTTYYQTKRAYAPSDRTVLIDLSEQVSEGSFPTPVTSAYMPAHLIAHCSRVGVDMVKMSVGQFAACPGSFRFWAPDGLWYRVSFNPDNFPGVDLIKVTCTAADSTGCKVWTATPTGTVLTGDDPNPKNLGKLLQIDQSGNILAYGGDYYLSFSITVAR